MGRPIINEADRLTERVSFRVTAETLIEYKRRLNGNITPSEFFRNCVMTNATEIIVKSPLTDDGKVALFLLKNIANNVNQMAKAINTALLAGLINDALAEQILKQLSLIIEHSKLEQSNVD
ncbi:TPA: plasmid mobilization relaxosome protein MobC [Yersinia enterocolitica]